MSPFIPFALPEITQAEIDEVADSMRSGWITSGPKVARFERAFAEFVGGGVEAVAVNSATAGLHLALEALEIGRGDEVIVPVHTFTATAEVVCYLDATPVFVDVDPDTLTLDAAAVAKAVTPRTRAVVPVHYAGLACDMAPLVDLARAAGIAIVEDAAHALPTTYDGRLIGALDTDATVFSFYANKTMTTGEGGMVTTRSPELARRVRIMRLHGIDRDVYDRYRGNASSWRYDVVAPGYKYNLTDVAAAIGIHQLARAEAMRRRREEIAAAYDEAFAGLPLRLPAHAQQGDLHSRHLYPVRLTDAAPIGRDDFIDGLRQAAIGSSVHYIPLHFQSFWRESFRLRPEDFPASTDAYGRLASLPIYSRMTDDDTRRVIRVVKQLLAG